MRQEFTRKTRREAADRAGGICDMCRLPIAGRAEYDHRIPWNMTRDSSVDNCQVLCVRCHRLKTGGDVKDIRKAQRRQDKASGAMKSQRGFRRWRKFDGTIVERKT